MIAACPRCATRHRVPREKLRPEGVRLRCARCETVFRVRPPAERTDAPAAPAAEPAPKPAAAPKAAPAAAGTAAEAAPPRRAEGDAAASAPAAAEGPARDATAVVVALPDAGSAKATAECLERRGLPAHVVHDGVEAMLEIQRRLPRAAILSAGLPRMYGFQVCEILKRNESLRSVRVVLVGAIHHRERYRRPPNDLYGADAYLEEPDLPEALPGVLERLGLELGAASGAERSPAAAEPPARPAAPAASPRAPAAPAPEAPSPEPAAPEPPSARAGAAPERAPPAPAAGAPAEAGDGLDEVRRKAERLARIIVSDIVLYNEEKFARALRSGSVTRDLAAELDEGRALFRERIDERVRAERDHLEEELLRVARARGTS